MTRRRVSILLILLLLCSVSAVTFRSKSCRTRDHILLFHLGKISPFVASYDGDILVRLRTGLLTDGQLASLCWYQATIWDARQIFLPLHGNYLQTFTFISVWGALSDERTSLQSTHTIATGPCQC
jgi:hypothetical protein